jgi:hypothetical protein
MCRAADVSELYAPSVFRVEVGRVNKCSYMYIYIYVYIYIYIGFVQTQGTGGGLPGGGQ